MSFTNAKQPRPVEDPAALVAFGWAPGEYHRTACSDCGQSHSGTDKKSSRCQDCAEKLRDNPPPPSAPMTAADHAELKRLADALRVSWSDRGWTPAKKIDGLLKEARQAADGLDALLSEIEGLKAERDHPTLSWKSRDPLPPSILAHALSQITAEGVIDVGERHIHADNLIAMAVDYLRTQAPDSWRPIETAPKDGSRVLLYSVANEVPGLRPHIADGYWRATTGLMAPGFWSLGQSVGPSFCPTHWTPLPAAPVLSPQTAESGK